MPVSTALAAQLVLLHLESAQDAAQVLALLMEPAQLVHMELIQLEAQEYV